jgi:dipeptidyl aminopeptidase/acylaminoacyl peptidase
MVFTLAAPAALGAQALRQSDLTFDDVDPTFKLTIDHLAEDQRWLGLSPRQVTWSPGSRWIYFRWREDPAPGQHTSTDPWYAASRDGREAHVVPDSDTWQIPSGNTAWSADGRVAAWANEGTLVVWAAGEDARAVHHSGTNLGDIRVSAEGRRVFFATKGFGFGFGSQSPESADLWMYDRADNRVAQIATAVQPTKEQSESDQWLRDQQLELIEYVRKRKKDRETADSVNRSRGLPPPQAIPVENGAVVRDLQLSPDGRYLTFRWMKDPSREHRTTYFEAINESGEATARDARPKVGTPRATYKFGIVRVDPTVPKDSVKVTWVDDGIEKATVMHGPYWSPTGENAVLQILSMDHKDRWIAMLDVEAGKTTVVDHQHDDAWIGGPLVVGRWAPGYLQWLPDGSAFAFASTATGWAMLYLADLDGNVVQLTSGEYEVRRASLSPDGRTWYLETSLEHPGETHLYQMDARGGELRRVTMGVGVHQSFVSPDGRKVAATFATPKTMPDLYVMDNRPGAEKTRITKSGTDDFYRYDWIGSELVTFPDREGNETWAEIWEQPGNSNGAAVIYAHGCGECAQAVDKGWTRVPAFLYANYLHQHGYTTASIDYRGSSGYGHENRTYAYRGMGIRDIDSGLSLLDVLVERYGVDPGRIGVYGGSYGGFYTIMALLRSPGRYAAGVALYPVTDWAHYNDGYTSRILNGTPTDDPEAYRVSSPIYYASQLQDALQIQHGLVDNNVQIQDSYRLAQVFIELGKDFDLVTYPVEAHGWRQVSTRRDSYRRMTRWWDMNLLGKPAAASGGGGRR